MTTVIVIIYLPNGNEVCYTTSQAVVDGSSKYKLATEINCESRRIEVKYMEDGKAAKEMYFSMPFLVQES